MVLVSIRVRRGRAVWQQIQSAVRDFQKLLVSEFLNFPTCKFCKASVLPGERHEICDRINSLSVPAIHACVICGKHEKLGNHDSCKAEIKLLHLQMNSLRRDMLIRNKRRD